MMNVPPLTWYLLASKTLGFLWSLYIFAFVQELCHVLYLLGGYFIGHLRLHQYVFATICKLQLNVEHWWPFRTRLSFQGLGHALFWIFQSYRWQDPLREWANYVFNHCVGQAYHFLWTWGLKRVCRWKLFRGLGFSECIIESIRNAPHNGRNA